MLLNQSMITGSVGHHGRNAASDVKLIQALLTETAKYPAERDLDPRRTDGSCDDRTIRSIGVFQSRFMDRPDSRVDPGGGTFRRLMRVGKSGLTCGPYSPAVSGADLVRALLPHDGEKYVLGAVVPKYHPLWIGPWDCAEFVAWGIFQVSGRYVGCRKGRAPNGVFYMNSYTGWFGQDLPLCATQITEEEASNTPGSIALRIGRGKGQIGHIAVSRGGDRTIEAAGSGEGVRSKRLSRRRWQSFWKLNFLRYPAQSYVV